MKEIGDRKKHILQLVINEYIRTGKPVSSQFICEEFNLGCSPATIRNELATLEKEGFLTHPHTSAGRVPTDDGYRYYVDVLMDIQKLTREEENRIKTEFKHKSQELDRIMQQTSKMLAAVSEFAGFMIAPNMIESRVEYIELAKLGTNRLLVLIVTEDGLVKHHIMPSKHDIDSLKIRDLSNVLNNRFRGKKISEIREHIIDAIIEEEKEKELMLSIAKELADNIFNIVDNRLYYLEECPQFGNINYEDFDSGAACDIFKQDDMLENLVSSEKKGVNIYVGARELSNSYKDCSLITSSFHIGGDKIGVLGIIGPKRMKYDKMVSLVEYVSNMVDKAMNEKD